MICGKKCCCFILAAAMTVSWCTCFSLNITAEEIYVPDDGSMKNIEIAKVTTAPTMDGQVDYSYTKIFDISGADTWYHKSYGDGNMRWVKDNHAPVDFNTEAGRYDAATNPERTSSEWYNSRLEGYASWDATNLYLCVVVTTPHKINDNPAGVNSWAGDNMEVAAHNYSRNAATKFVFSQVQGELQVYPAATDGLGAIQRRKTYDTTKTIAQKGVEPDGGIYITETGYVYELTLDWSIGFGITATENASIPFNVAVNFNDAAADMDTSCGIQAGAGIYNEGGKVDLLTRSLNQYLGFALKLVDILTCEHYDTEWVGYKEFSETEGSGEVRKVCKDCGEIIATKYLDHLAPKVVDVNCKSIRVFDISGFEYRLKGGQWQKTGFFDNLLPETEYIIEYRFENSEQIYSLTAKTRHVDSDGKWKYNETEHFHTCTCGYKLDILSHKGGEATCKTRATCEVCGTLYGKTDMTNHKNIVLQGDYSPTCKDKGYSGDRVCLDCNTVVENGHEIPANGIHIQADSKWKYDENGHFRICDICRAEFDRENHKGGEATCKDRATCETCGKTYGGLDTNNHKNYLITESNANFHWQKCTGCGLSYDLKNHIYTNARDKMCDVCNHIREIHEESFCSSCSGYGTVEHQYKCSNCKGQGTVKDGQEPQTEYCTTCWGSGGFESDMPKTCPDCKGYGGSCLGECYRGHQYWLNQTKDGKCPTCKQDCRPGTLKYYTICKKCNGCGQIKEKKFIKCKACNGEGKRTVFVNKYKTCSSCSGSGKKIQRIQCSACSGTGNILGDVNGDGIVNNYDRLLLTRWLAKWPEALEQGIIEAAADVNCDGKVNNLDRLILTRHLAHWAEYATLPYVG